MRQWDALVQAVLPNLGRSHAQRRLAQGSSSRDPTNTPMGDSLRPARFVFFDEDMKSYVGDKGPRSSNKALKDYIHPPK